MGRVVSKDGRYSTTNGRDEGVIKGLMDSAAHIHLFFLFKLLLLPLQELSCGADAPIGAHPSHFSFHGFVVAAKRMLLLTCNWETPSARCYP